MFASPLESTHGSCCTWSFNRTVVLDFGDDEIVVTHRALIVIKVSCVTVRCAMVLRKTIRTYSTLKWNLKETCAFLEKKNTHLCWQYTQSSAHICKICLSSNSLLPQQYFTGLECGHKFCMQCWGDYLTTKIIEEGMGQVRSNIYEGVGSLWGFGSFHWLMRRRLFFPSQTISCPAHSCDILVDDNTVM